MSKTRLLRLALLASSLTASLVRIGWVNSPRPNQGLGAIDLFLVLGVGGAIILELTCSGSQRPLGGRLPASGASEPSLAERVDDNAPPKFAVPDIGLDREDDGGDDDARQLVLHVRDNAQQSRINDLESTLNRKTLELAHNSLELKFAEARRSVILEAAIDGIISFDHERRIVEFNPAAERAFGIPKAAALGNDLVETIIPVQEREAQRRMLSAWLERYDRAQSEMIELTVARADGSTFSVEVAIARVEVRGTFIYTAYLRDITERRRIEQMKSEFIAVVSHELRSPLTSILGSLGLVEGGVFGQLPTRVLELVRIARSNTDRLIRLVSDILDLEKIEAGRFAVQRSTVDPQELMAAACQGLRGMADAAGVELRSQSLYSEPFDGDRDRLIQVLTNLISNAIKFSPRAGWIDIRSMPGSAGLVRFSVTDQGPGIQAVHIPLLFGKFQQLDASDSRSRGGTGLGLAICKAIIELHGGRMVVDSAPGRGSTFSFELPVKATFEACPACP